MATQIHKLKLTTPQAETLLDGIWQQILDTQAKLAELKAQHKDISQQIKGEPSASLSDTTNRAGASPDNSTPKASNGQAGRRGMSEEGRRRVAEAQKARWAKTKGQVPTATAVEASPTPDAEPTVVEVA